MAAVRALVLAAGVWACVVAHGCRNSILRNTVEAGLETVLEEPLPTPTLAARDASP